MWLSNAGREGFGDGCSGQLVDADRRGEGARIYVARMARRERSELVWPGRRGAYECGAVALEQLLLKNCPTRSVELGGGSESWPEMLAYRGRLREAGLVALLNSCMTLGVSCGWDKVREDRVGDTTCSS